ncbi:hypothetical protein PG984_001310 [Apiospora sp. TS-2023a]
MLPTSLHDTAADSDDDPGKNGGVWERALLTAAARKIGIVGLVYQFVEKNQKSERYRQVESDAWNKKGEGRRANEVTENRKMGSMGPDRFAAQRSGLMEMLKG